MVAAKSKTDVRLARYSGLIKQNLYDGNFNSTMSWIPHTGKIRNATTAYSRLLSRAQLFLVVVFVHFWTSCQGSIIGSTWHDTSKASGMFGCVIVGKGKILGFKNYRSVDNWTSVFNIQTKLRWTHS